MKSRLTAHMGALLSIVAGIGLGACGGEGYDGDDFDTVSSDLRANPKPPKAPKLRWRKPDRAAINRCGKLRPPPTRGVDTVSCTCVDGATVNGCSKVPNEDTATAACIPLCKAHQGVVSSGYERNAEVCSTGTYVAPGPDLMAPVVAPFDTPTSLPFISVGGSVPTPISVAFSDAVGVTSCVLHVIHANAFLQFPAVLESKDGGATGTAHATVVLPFQVRGSPSRAYMSCQDAAGNVSTNEDIRFIVLAEADTTPPVVGPFPVNPVPVTDGRPTLLQVPVSDSGMVECTLRVTYFGTTEYTVIAYPPQVEVLLQLESRAGRRRKSLQVECVDTSGNVGTSEEVPFTFVAVPPVDVTPPVLGSLQGPTQVMAGAPSLYSATFSEDVGVVSCALVAEGSGARTERAAVLDSNDGGVSGTARVSLSFPWLPWIGASQTWSVHLECVDAAGHVTWTDTLPAWVSPSAEATGAPLLGAVQGPATIVRGELTTFSVDFTDDVGVVSCALSADQLGASPVGMAAVLESNDAGLTGSAHVSVELSGIGSTWYLSYQCSDAEGNIGVSEVFTVNRAPRT